MLSLIGIADNICQGISQKLKSDLISWEMMKLNFSREPAG